MLYCDTLFESDVSFYFSLLLYFIATRVEETPACVFQFHVRRSFNIM